MGTIAARQPAATAAATILALACKLVSPVPPASIATPRAPAAGEIGSVRDDFSNADSSWETEATSDDSIRYADDGLQLMAWSSEWFTWSNFGNQTFTDVHVEVTARSKEGQDGFSFGVMCDRQGKQNAYYYLVISSSGQYLIGKSEVDKNDIWLTGGGQWAESKLIAEDAGSYRIGADCRRGTLALFVDGHRIDSVADSTYTTGRIGLILWSGTGPAGPVTFDDFVITPLH